MKIVGVSSAIVNIVRGLAVPSGGIADSVSAAILESIQRKPWLHWHEDQDKMLGVRVREFRGEAESGGASMQIVMAKDRPSLGEYVGRAAAEVLRRCISEKGGATLVVATGSSQFEVLESLVRQPEIDWSKVDGFHLDEYVGLSQSHPASFCGYLAKRFVERVPLRSFYYLKGATPAEQLRSEASAAIAGRSIDLALVGIGENGHLAFNDPPADFATTEPYLIVELDEACRRQQVGEGWFDSLEQVPKQAISMSVQQILKAQRIFCSVPDRRKAEAVRNSVEGSVTPLVPASILQQHPATELIIDEPAGMLLSAELLTAVHRVAS